MYDLLLAVHNIELIGIRLEADTFTAHIISRHQVSVLLSKYLKGFVDKLLVGNVVFCLEGDDEGLGAGLSKVCNYFRGGLEIQGEGSLFPSLDLVGHGVLGFVIAGGSRGENKVVSSLFQ